MGRQTSTIAGMESSGSLPRPILILLVCGGIFFAYLSIKYAKKVQAKRAYAAEVAEEKREKAAADEASKARRATSAKSAAPPSHSGSRAPAP